MSMFNIEAFENLIAAAKESTRKTLESLPLKRDSLPRMDLEKLPKQTFGSNNVEEIETQEDHREIRGTFFESVVREGDIEKDMCTGIRAVQRCTTINFHTFSWIFNRCSPTFYIKQILAKPGTALQTHVLI